MEDEIRSLRDQLLGERDQARAVELATRLRAALHGYIEQTRVKIALMAPRAILGKPASRPRQKQKPEQPLPPKAVTPL